MLLQTHYNQFYIFKNREQRNEFIEKTNGMIKNDREIIYQKYQS